MAKKSSVDIDDTDIFDDFADVESEENILDDFDARRRLEKVLEDKALERLIYGDFYDGDNSGDIFDYD